MLYSKQYKADLLTAQKSVPNLHKLNHAKILITGAGGLIGSAIVDFLVSANDYLRLDNRIFAGGRDKKRIERRFETYCGRDDFSYQKFNAQDNFEADEKFDYIIHAASPADPAEYASKPVETMFANLFGTHSLLEYAKENGTKRILFVSSSEVYGNGSYPYEESNYGFVDILNPRACYPSSKRCAETLLTCYLDEYKVDGVIARPGHIYGPTALTSDTRAASSFFHDVIRGQDIIMKSPGRQCRSYCYVVDCVSAILCILTCGASGHAYNIANDDSNVTIRELAEEIAKVSKRKIIFDVPTERELKGYNLMTNSTLSSAKLNDLGWNGLFDLHAGVAHTYEMMMLNYR